MTDDEQPRWEERQDTYSGIPWVYVSRAEVWAHPKGQLTGLLWAIALYLILAGIGKAGLLIGQGVPVGWALLLGAFPLACGMGLILRAPWAVVLAAVSAGLTVFQLLGGLGQVGALGGNAVDFGGLSPQFWTLIHLLISVGIVFYLIDGDRPNFIYRHRYRKYSAVRDE